MSKLNKVYASGIKGSPKKPVKKLVTIDITEFYDSLKNRADEEVRSVEEQCKFLIKRGLNLLNGDVTNITYIHQPSWGSTNTTPPQRQEWWGYLGGAPITTYCHNGGATSRCCDKAFDDINDVTETIVAANGTFEASSTAKV